MWHSVLSAPKKSWAVTCVRWIFLALLRLVLCIIAGSMPATENYSVQSVKCSGTCGRGRRWGSLRKSWLHEMGYRAPLTRAVQLQRCCSHSKLRHLCLPCCHTELGWRRAHLSAHLLDFGGSWKPANSHCKPNGNPVSVTEDKNLLCLLWILSKWYEGSCLPLSSGLKWATCMRNSVLEQGLIFMCYWHMCPPHLTRISWFCSLVAPYYLRQKGSCNHMKERITSTSFSWSKML